MTDLTARIEDAVRSFVQEQREAVVEAETTPDLFDGVEQSNETAHRSVAAYAGLVRVAEAVEGRTVDPAPADGSDDDADALTLAVMLMAADVADLSGSIGATVDDVLTRCAAIS